MRERRERERVEITRRDRRRDVANPDGAGLPDVELRRIVDRTEYFLLYRLLVVQQRRHLLKPAWSPLTAIDTTV